jgi:hypothetical protein
LGIELVGAKKRGVPKRMNHDLAKELKAAGFPNIKDLQHRQGREFIPPNGTVRVYSLGDAADVENWFIPTLEELIAAVFALVPDKFLDLSSRSDRDQLWSATSTWCIGSGSTPEEAVARLWLALQNRT